VIFEDRQLDLEDLLPCKRVLNVMFQLLITKLKIWEMS